MVDQPSEQRQREVVRSLAAQVRSARELAGFSQEVVAERSGVDIQTYAAIERGYTRRGTNANPRLSTLIRIFEALHMDIESGERR